MKAMDGWVANYMAKGKTLEELEKALVRKTVSELKAITSNLGIDWVEGTKAVVARYIVECMTTEGSSEHQETESNEEPEIIEEPIEEPESIEEVEEVTAVVAVVAVDAAEVATVETGSAETETRFITLDDVGNVIKGVGEIIGMVVDEVKAEAPAVARKVCSGLQVLAVILLSVWDALAFWIPTISSRIGFWSVWVVRPDVIRKARTVKRMAKATALSTLEAVTAVRNGLKDLWKMREELVAEYKEAA